MHKRGWSALKNGELLRQAEEAEFEVFVTADQGIRYQQVLTGRKIAILELGTNDLRRILAVGAKIQAAVARIKAGEYQRIEVP